MDLSIIVTAHSEGVLAHKTMLSIFEATRELQTKKYEFIIHIDKGDEATKGYFNRYKNNPRFRIYENSFGDLGESRNFAISKAKGEFIITIDADDLISKNLLHDALVYGRRDDTLLYHPNYLFSFGTRHELQVYKDYCNKDYSAFMLFSRNIWPAMVFGKRQLFLDAPYRRTENGYGNEDYNFNVETISKGVGHAIIPNTIEFYRRKENSLLTASDANGVIWYESDLFNFRDFIRNPYLKLAEEDKWTYVKNRKAVKIILRPILAIARRALRYSGIYYSCKPYIDDVFMEHIKAANAIDSRILPSNVSIRNICFHNPFVEFQPSIAYASIAKSLDESRKNILIVSRLDNEVSDLVKHISKKERNDAILLITEDKNETRSTINGIKIINVSSVISDLTLNDGDILLSRLISQLKCKSLYVSDSDFGLGWIKRHRLFCQHNLSIFILLTKSRKLHLLADKYLSDISMLVSKYFYTSNEVFNSFLEYSGLSRVVPSRKL